MHEPWVPEDERRLAAQNSFPCGRAGDGRDGPGRSGELERVRTRRHETHVRKLRNATEEAAIPIRGEFVAVSLLLSRMFFDIQLPALGKRGGEHLYHQDLVDKDASLRARRAFGLIVKRCVDIRFRKIYWFLVSFLLIEYSRFQQLKKSHGCPLEYRSVFNERQERFCAAAEFPPSECLKFPLFDVWRGWVWRRRDFPIMLSQVKRKVL